MSASYQNQGRSNPSPGEVSYDDGLVSFEDGGRPNAPWRDEYNSATCAADQVHDAGLDMIGSGNDQLSTFKGSDVQETS